jgi:hypothetical protein
MRETNRESVVMLSFYHAPEEQTPPSGYEIARIAMAPELARALIGLLTQVMNSGPTERPNVAQ